MRHAADLDRKSGNPEEFPRLAGAGVSLCFNIFNQGEHYLASIKQLMQPQVSAAGFEHTHTHTNTNKKKLHDDLCIISHAIIKGQFTANVCIVQKHAETATHLQLQLVHLSAWPMGIFVPALPAHAQPKPVLSTWHHHTQYCPRNWSLALYQNYRLDSIITIIIINWSLKAIPIS